MTTKSEWRKELRGRLRQLGDSDPSDRASREKRLSDVLSKILSRRQGLWLSFSPMGEEPRFLSSQSASGCRFAYPKIKDSTSMTFYVAEELSSARWSKNSFGIEEPDVVDENWSEILPSSGLKGRSSVDVVGALVPGLGFDTRLRRLGRGRGFYDRYFCDLKTQGCELIKLGVGFHEQVVDQLPSDSSDVSMDGVLTDREVIWNPSFKF